MADTSDIEWTGATWNVITGCSLESPGCTNCYAMKLAGTRLKNHPSRKGLTIITKTGPVWNGVVRFNDQWLMQPIQWKKPRPVFVCAHADLFHPDVPDAWIDKVFAVMGAARWHTFQVLTKRAARMRAYLTHPDVWRRIREAAQSMGLWGQYGWTAVVKDGEEYLPNVWLGISAENDEWFRKRIRDLMETPAAVRWVSAEPLLGPIDLRLYLAHWRDGFGRLHRCFPKGIDWVVAGGESTKQARVPSPSWFYSLRDQCLGAGVPFFFKQWGTWAPPRFSPIDEVKLGEIQIARAADDTLMEMGSKKYHGAELEGMEWKQMPPLARAA